MINIDELTMPDGNEFKVPAEWLHNLFRQWTNDEYKGTQYEGDKYYINGVATAEYENIEPDTVDDIFDCAKSAGVIIDIKHNYSNPNFDAQRYKD